MSCLSRFKGWSCLNIINGWEVKIWLQDNILNPSSVWQCLRGICDLIQPVLGLFGHQINGEPHLKNAVGPVELVVRSD